jgi:hypothetical protein
MDNLQKIEFGAVLLLLLFHILFLLDNVNVISGFFLFEDAKISNAPSDFIGEDKIFAYPDRLVIEIENYSLSRYASSESMIPLFDDGANGVGIKPNSEDELRVGDVITFRQGDDLIVHRIIEKGIDNEGYFFITKGDNNNLPDEKIRFSQIDSVLVVLIY